MLAAAKRKASKNISWMGRASSRELERDKSEAGELPRGDSIGKSPSSSFGSRASSFGSDGQPKRKQPMRKMLKLFGLVKVSCCTPKQSTLPLYLAVWG